MCSSENYVTVVLFKITCNKKFNMIEKIIPLTTNAKSTNRTAARHAAHLAPFIFPAKQSGINEYLLLVCRCV